MKTIVFSVTVVADVLSLDCCCITLTLTGRSRILDKGIFWDSAYCIHCYCLHYDNCSFN